MAVLGKVVITPKGEYSDHASYDKLDCVYKDGSTWLAKQPTQSNPPPNDGSESNDYWQLLARGVPIDTKDSTVTFEEAEEDGELISGSPHSVLFGLIKKKFADIFASLASKLSTANIANNLVTTEPGFALDARQGKALNDKINDVNNNLAAMNSNDIKKGTVVNSNDGVRINSGIFQIGSNPGLNVVIDYNGTINFYNKGLLDLSYSLKSLDYSGANGTVAVFGNNTVGGHYRAFIPIANANKYNITITSAIIQGVKELDVSTIIIVGVSRSGYSIGCTDSSVAMNSVDIAYTLTLK